MGIRGANDDWANWGETGSAESVVDPAPRNQGTPFSRNPSDEILERGWRTHNTPGLLKANPVDTEVPGTG